MQDADLRVWGVPSSPRGLANLELLRSPGQHVNPLTVLRSLATRGRLIGVVTWCALLAGCTRIRASDNFNLDGYWRTEGYVCHDQASALIVRLEHDGSALTAFQVEADACGARGDVNWLGELASGSVKRSQLPITFTALVHMYVRNEGVRLFPGLANVVAVDELVIRMPDGTRYVLTRISGPMGPSDASEEGDDPGASDAGTGVAEGDDGKRDGGALRPVGPRRGDAGTGSRTDDTEATDSGANDSSSMRDSGAEPTEAADPGGSAAADSGTSGTSAMTDAGAVDPQPPEAGSSADPMEPAAGEGEPPSTEPQPTDGWDCFDSEDRDGLPYCNCSRSSQQSSDACALPKPPCCFMVTTILAQCLCYQADSPACDNLGDQSEVLGTTPVPTCPPP